MEALTLAAALEREFDLEIPDEDLNVDLFRSLGALSDYVLRNIRNIMNSQPMQPSERPTTLCEMLASTASVNPDATAIVDEQLSVSYAELIGRIDAYRP